MSAISRASWIGSIAGLPGMVPTLLAPVRSGAARACFGARSSSARVLGVGACGVSRGGGGGGGGGGGWGFTSGGEATLRPGGCR